MEQWLLATVNGLAYGALLFMLAAGLSLSLGVLRIANLAHGTLYLFGGYIAWEMLRSAGSYPAALVVSVIAVGVLGASLYRLLIAQQGLVHNELGQVLLTVGVLLFLDDLIMVIWGGVPQRIAEPSLLARSVPFGDLSIPFYRLFLIGIALAVGVSLWLFLERTRWGSRVRATVDDSELAACSGVNPRTVHMLIFAGGAGLAGLGGLLGSPVVGLYPGADLEVLILALVVVVVGGMGSLLGSAVGAFLVGVLDTWGKTFFPEFGPYSLFGLMMVMLLLRPTGLLGREVVVRR